MKIGFIGCGNMATAMLKGILKSGEVKNGDMIASAKSDKTREKIEKELGIQKADTNAQVVDFADVVFLAVKPQFLEEVLDEIKDNVKEGQIFISIAPGKTLQWLGEHLGEGTKIIRTMPNTPAMVGEGMSGVSYDENLFTDEEKQVIDGFFTSFGKMEKVDEKLMDVVGSASGCSPAYVYMFIEALADGCVKNGLPRQAAYKMVAQAVLGSAKMVLETGKHPGELKDMVCSPGGTTIEGLAALEENGFRGAIIKACDANFEKNKKLKG